MTNEGRISAYEWDWDDRERKGIILTIDRCEYMYR